MTGDPEEPGDWAATLGSKYGTGTLKEVTPGERIHSENTWRASQRALPRSLFGDLRMWLLLLI